MHSWLIKVLDFHFEILILNQSVKLISQRIWVWNSILVIVYPLSQILNTHLILSITVSTTFNLSHPQKKLQKEEKNYTTSKKCSRLLIFLVRLLPCSTSLLQHHLPCLPFVARAISMPTPRPSPPLPQPATESSLHSLHLCTQDLSHWPSHHKRQ